jgi:preprotein translocase subunit YajC
MTFAPLIAIVGIFYFLLIRPQQKQAKEHARMVNELKRGDRILTQGGLYGTVHAVKGKVIEVKISEETKVLIAKSFRHPSGSDRSRSRGGVGYRTAQQGVTLHA